MEDDRTLGPGFAACGVAEPRREVRGTGPDRRILLRAASVRGQGHGSGKPPAPVRSGTRRSAAGRAAPRSRPVRVNPRGVRPSASRLHRRHRLARCPSTKAPEVRRSPHAHRRHPHRQQPARRHQRHHRGAARRRADQVRDGQGGRRAVRRPLPLHADALSGELRLRAAHAVGRWRPDRRAGRATRARSFPAASSTAARSACCSWRTTAARTRRSSPCRRPKLTHALRQRERPTPTCRRSRSSRSSTSSSTTRIWSPASG